MTKVFAMDKHQTTLAKLHAKIVANVKKARCDCWKYERQVCDICQKVDPKNPAPDKTPAAAMTDTN